MFFQLQAEQKRVSQHTVVFLFPPWWVSNVFEKCSAVHVPKHKVTLWRFSIKETFQSSHRFKWSQPNAFTVYCKHEHGKTQKPDSNKHAFSYILNERLSGSHSALHHLRAPEEKHRPSQCHDSNSHLLSPILLFLKRVPFLRTPWFWRLMTHR